MQTSETPGMKPNDYEKLRKKRNDLRDVSLTYSPIEYYKAKKQIKEYDLILSKYEAK